MTDLRDKIAKAFGDECALLIDAWPEDYQCETAADAILEIVEAQHRAELEAVREWCAAKADSIEDQAMAENRTGHLGDEYWPSRVAAEIRAKPIEEIMKEVRK